MNLSDFFAQCEKEMPEKSTGLRRTSFALRRAGVNTMEVLCDMQTNTPEKVENIRDIGPQSLDLIQEVVSLFLRCI